jgi:hypothetical protein
LTNVEGSVDSYFGPKALATKGWNTLLRLYSPLDPWFDETWRPGEIELVK